MKKSMDNKDGSLDIYLFSEGTNFESYNYYGAHCIDGDWYFRVWAPNADSIYLVGDFNNFQKIDKLEKISPNGTWEIVIEKTKYKLEYGMHYKYLVVHNSRETFKSDPFCFESETLHNTASVLTDIEGYVWDDKAWICDRKEKMNLGSQMYSQPINIYELHLGSWKTKDSKSTESGENYLSYRELADEISLYAREMGYTHVELMPIMEYPYDGSWGYQICSYFAPSSRFGKPKDFMYFVDTLHKNGVGVILDFVPAHFPKDEHGLYEFDGTRQYEYQGDDRVESQNWGTRFFDVGRPEIQSFLISSACFFIDKYHIDGLRIDAVASMLYLDYDKKPGEWVPNCHNSNENLEAVAFFKKFNSVLKNRYPDVMICAEESTAFAKLTVPVKYGGLGFDFKWNMGWTNDIFEYISTDPFFRKHLHNKLTFSMTYAFSEKFILPVSHDEVVHGKLSLIDKNFGDYELKFKGIRAFMCYMIAHPGKKLSFMGCEYGQFREWDYKNSLEWFLLQYETHRKLRYFTAELNHFYLNHSELWEIDYSWDGFRWLTVDDAEKNIIAFERYDTCRNTLLCVINFAPVTRTDYIIYNATCESYREVFNSDYKKFNGSGVRNQKKIKRIEGKLNITVPSMSGIFLEGKGSKIIDSPKNDVIRAEIRNTEKEFL